MSKTFTDVSVFMSAAGQDVPSAPMKFRSMQSELYKNLIKEEYTEFFEAYDAKDDVEEIDACFDMMWVIIGYMKSRGWDCEKVWDEGAQSNLSKIDSATGKCIKRDDGKILKPEGWKPPDFTKFAK